MLLGGKNKPSYWEEVPPSVLPRLHLYTTPVDNATDSPANPLNIILATSQPGDLVVVKLDVDNAPLELSYMNRIAVSGCLTCARGCCPFCVGTRGVGNAGRCGHAPQYTAPSCAPVASAPARQPANLPVCPPARVFPPPRACSALRWTPRCAP